MAPRPNGQQKKCVSGWVGGMCHGSHSGTEAALVRQLAVQVPGPLASQGCASLWLAQDTTLLGHLGQDSCRQCHVGPLPTACTLWLNCMPCRMAGLRAVLSPAQHTCSGKISATNKELFGTPGVSPNPGTCSNQRGRKIVPTMMKPQHGITGGGDWLAKS